MIQALLIDTDVGALNVLETNIRQYCPEVSIWGKARDTQELFFAPGNRLPNLLFVGWKSCTMPLAQPLNDLLFKKIEIIVMSRLREKAYEAIRIGASGFLQQPVESGELIQAVGVAKRRIDQQEDQAKGQGIIHDINARMSEDNLIGIPTMEGFDFIKIREILRCEGMQRCTAVLTTGNKKIVSSYNLGEFRKVLEPVCFFSPHRSHLINMNYIRQYKNEGTIVMMDGTFVPVAKRKKAEFLKVILRV